MYIESSIREVQLLELSILNAVVDICEKHNIRYYLSCGTLLGAVRHKGFIPWDNDIDIEMPIKDYRRFLRIAKKELPDNLFLKNYKTCKGYNEMWTKIGVNGTTSLPIVLKDWDMHWGISLDIFPMAGLYENTILSSLQHRLLNFCRTLLSKEYVVAVHPDELSGNQKLQLLYKIPRFIRTSLCSLFSYFIMKNPRRSKRLSIVSYRIAFPINIQAYEPPSKVLFENTFYCAPGNSHQVLSSMYGDYMTPPPKSEQGSTEPHLGKIIYSCVTDYKDVLEELNRNSAR